RTLISTSYLIYSLLFLLSIFPLLFFYTPPSPSVIYPLSLHDALPIWSVLDHSRRRSPDVFRNSLAQWPLAPTLPSRPIFIGPQLDRKSTRLNSSHDQISYAVFCLKKKKKKKKKIISTKIKHIYNIKK